MGGPAGTLRHLHEQLHRKHLDRSGHGRRIKKGHEELHRLSAPQAPEPRIHGSHHDLKLPEVPMGQGPTGEGRHPHFAAHRQLTLMKTATSEFSFGVAGVIRAKLSRNRPRHGRATARPRAQNVTNRRLVAIVIVNRPMRARLMVDLRLLALRSNSVRASPFSARGDSRRSAVAYSPLWAAATASSSSAAGDEVTGSNTCERAERVLTTVVNMNAGPSPSPRPPQGVLLCGNQAILRPQGQ